MPFPQSKEVIFFSKYPALQDLCSVILTVPASEGVNMAVASYQPQLIKARELIFTEPEIIATPLLNKERKVQVIMQQSLFKTGRLQTRFKRMNIEAEKPKRVTSGDFQSCLRYTVQAKLAPLWNKVGEYFLQGRDFVTNNQKLSSVKMDMYVNAQDLYMTLRSYQTRARPIQLSDLDIPPQVLTNFLASKPNGHIAEQFIGNQWVHILPSMKRGQVVSVHHQIPPDSPFTSYKDVKRYWKNTYGYRLPENEDGMIYYQLYFRPIGDVLFTYPECCVRFREISNLAQVDTVSVMKSFLHDLHLKVPTICGMNMEFAEKGLFPTPELIDIDQLKTKTKNLSNLIEYNPKDIRPKYQSIANQTAKSTWKPSADIERVNNARGRPQQARSQNMGPGGDHTNDQRKDDEDVIPDTQQNGADRIRPVFKPKVYQKQFPRSTVVASSVPKVKPIFVPTKPKSVFPDMNSTMNTSGTNASYDILPNQDCENQVRSQVNQMKNAPKFAPKVVPKPVFFGSQKIHAKTSTSKTKTMANSTPGTVQRKQIPASGSSLSSGYGSMYESVHDDGFQPSAPPRPCFAQHGPNTTPLSTASIGTPSLKRKLPATELDTPKSKKPRARPKLQENMDIPLLAANNQLEKVNGPTLLSWLKDKNVPCRTKDKKGELVNKVMHYLGLTCSVEQ